MLIYVNVELKENEEHELAKIFGCKKTEISDVLSTHVSAAAEELVTMYLGQKVFSRGSDMREYRLYLLIKHAFQSKIPSEQEVCKLFQVTTTSSRSLIRAVMSKYQYLLVDAIANTLIECLEEAIASENDQIITIAVSNLNLVDELNRKLAEIDTNLPAIKKKSGTVSTFEIKPSSYNRLCNYYQIKPKLVNNE